MACLVVALCTESDSASVTSSAFGTSASAIELTAALFLVRLLREKRHERLQAKKTKRRSLRYETSRRWAFQVFADEPDHR